MKIYKTLACLTAICIGVLIIFWVRLPEAPFHSPLNNSDAGGQNINQQQHAKPGLPPGISSVRLTEEERRTNYSAFVAKMSALLASGYDSSEIVPLTPIPPPVPGLHVEYSPLPGQELDVISAGLRNYRTMFGSFPNGDAAAIARKLSGENPSNRHMIFWPKHLFSSNGAFLDTWRERIEIQCFDDGRIEVRSRGPDGSLGTGDDLVHRRNYGPKNPWEWGLW